MSRKLLLTVVAFVCAGNAVFADQAGSTALGALKILPKAAAAKVAMIEAREGRPSPSRWHIIVHDPKEESGLHEYVIANGEIVASRALSQFAESLTPEDVIKDVVKIDSDRAAKLAQLYAEANNLPLAEMNFELKRDGEGAAPVWNVTCLDAQGNELGRLVLTATKGTIVSHDGFAVDPPNLDKAKLAADGAIVHAEPIAEKRPKKQDLRKAEPVVSGPNEDRPGFLQRAGGSLQHFFTGH